MGRRVVRYRGRVARYALTIAYDGTDFHGWQKQYRAAPPEAPLPEGAERDASGRIVLRTVQSVVERAVRESVREPVELRGASRTDAGVHALAQCAVFTTSDERQGAPDDRLAMAINARLPDDALVTEARRVHPTFDPIGHCVAKGYRYTLHVSPDRPLWNRHYAHHVHVPLDVDAMREGASRLVGQHDFAAFAAAHHGRKSTVRTVLACVVQQPNDTAITIDISGDGFLYNMVRIVAGTLVDVGRGRMTPDDVGAALASLDRRNAGPTLPPQGLRLEWIRHHPASLDPNATNVPATRFGPSEDENGGADD
ncbi:MAG: tRNA pseudouridine(38-40) synthase TruA [Phycisphaerales bacterium]|nr:MAG: tRNA pseudouridine(38-40) synthase TruA [Phycisphaerales bacterium]